VNRSGRREDSLLLALLIAAALHALLIFGVSFDAGRVADAAAPFEVTLLQVPSTAPQRDTRYRAAQNQAGSGVEALREYAAGGPGAGPAARPRAPVPAGQAGEPGQRDLLTSSAAARRVTRDTASDPLLEPAGQPDRELARLEERLQALEARLDPARAASGEERIRRLDPVAAQSAEDAAYLAAWRQRVEAVGNRYYPEASLRYGIFGELRMLVSVRSDGALESIRILESSGQAVLDDAAVRIVRMAAPFPPFPADLRASTDRLEIVRTWQFEQNPLSSE